MESVAAILILFAGIVIGSIIVKALRAPVRGTGGPAHPVVRKNPSADEPTPAKSATTNQATAQRAQLKTPPA